ncbi:MULTISPECIES: hypothetical protein [unclassified Kitasatospora]|uniref:hypothetical protein n=1 Tax=unclassified Kitasatospora TaxID=2633591 RepID=UPI0033F5AFC7
MRALAEGRLHTLLITDDLAFHHSAWFGAGATDITDRRVPSRPGHRPLIRFHDRLSARDQATTERFLSRRARRSGAFEGVSVPAEEPQRGEARCNRVGSEDGEIGASPAESEPCVLHRRDEVREWQRAADVAKARGENSSGWRGA